MDKNRIQGAAKEFKGTMKDAAGKITGDTSLQAKGKLEKAGGKVQKSFGEARDEARAAREQARERHEDRND
ncbi:MAG TPA: CsbD family protein [Phycisphaerales bacterium]|nr:CsbD family protein [Phycisphaerales bacterium]